MLCPLRRMSAVSDQLDGSRGRVGITNARAHWASVGVVMHARDGGGAGAEGWCWK
jgi:hypothetical protein